ncbi:MAG: glycosyltransferase [Clostridia bacterium]|nr:glycosyltransferase [Clostridia bacterium]
MSKNNKKNASSDCGQGKVLFVNLRLTGGGSEKVMAHLASYYADHGIDTEMFLLSDEERTYPVSDKLKITECFCPRTGSKKIWHVKRILSLRKAIKKSGANTVISFMWDINMNVVLACAGLRKKVIISERADPRNVVARRKSLEFAMKWVFPHADMTVFQTPEAQTTYPEKVRRKSTVIPNPVVLKNIGEANGSTAEREKTVIAAGRFTEQKNFAMLIRAFSIFGKDHPDYTLTIFGDGSLRDKQEALVTELGLDGRVSMPGFVNDLGERMKSAGIYASSSDFEGISNSMLEALAAGIPSVCTDCPVGGAAMAIDDHKSGILVKTGDAEGMARAFAEIADDAGFARTLSDNAVEKSREFLIDNVAKKWMSL